MDHHNRLTYSREIKLGPAIGDWTTIKPTHWSTALQDHEENHVFQVRGTNFDSLPRDKMRYAHYLHYRLAEKWVEKLSTDMNIKIELHAVNASQVAYEDFLSELPERAIQAHFVIENTGKMNVLMDWSLAESIVDRLTGGKGEESETNAFSDIETSILEAQLEEVIPPFSDIWKSVFSPNQVQVEFSVGSPTQDKKISLRDGMVIFVFQLQLGTGSLKQLTLAYPADLLRRLLYSRSLIPDALKFRVRLIPKTIKSVKVDVKATLGKTNLTMNELKSLQPGDILPLDTSLDSPIEVTLGRDTRFYGQAGMVHNRICVQLIFTDRLVSLSPPVTSKPPTPTPVEVVVPPTPAPPPPEPVYQAPRIEYYSPPTPAPAPVVTVPSATPLPPIPQPIPEPPVAIEEDDFFNDHDHDDWHDEDDHEDELAHDETPVQASVSPLSEPEEQPILEHEEETDPDQESEHEDDDWNFDDEEDDLPHEEDTFNPEDTQDSEPHSDTTAKKPAPTPSDDDDFSWDDLG